MKAKVIKKFNDKYTNEQYEVGQILNIPKKRFKEILKVDALVEEIVDEVVNEVVEEIVDEVVNEVVEEIVDEVVNKVND